MTNLKPLWDHVVLEVIEKENETKSGIVLPSKGDEKPSMAKVVAVGPGKQLEDGSRSDMDVEEWDVVVFTKYSPDEVEVDGNEYLVIKYSSILAKKTS